MNTRSLNNPAVHVLALGAILGAALIAAVGPPSSGEETTRVVITAGDLLQLRAAFVRTWQREPTRIELANLLDKHIRIADDHWKIAGIELTSEGKTSVSRSVT